MAKCADCLLLVGFLSMSGVGSAAHFYRMGDLLGGDTFSRANAVSGDGSTTVGYSASVNGLEAVRWTIEDGLVGLGDLPGGVFSSIANGVSFDGRVIVGNGSTIPACGACSGSVSAAWHEPGSFPPEMHTGGIRSVAWDVTANGLMAVGTRQNATSEPTFAFLGSSDIGFRGGEGTFYEAFGVSADGSVVVGEGSFPTPAPPHNIPEAMIWTPGPTARGTIAGLGMFRADWKSRANSVSADGTTIVGQAQTGSGEKAVIFQPLALLDELPGGNGESEANAVSGDGNIIVGWAAVAGNPHAVIWRRGRPGAQRIEDYLVPFGVDLGEWTLNEATGISDDGLVIVGVGTNDSGRSEGWVIVIPEPSSLSFFCLLIPAFVRIKCLHDPVC